MIPLSTAVYDPKWFHQGKGHSYQYKDKNGVWNGIRAEEFAPGPLCEGLCRGPKYCNTKNSPSCDFLTQYRKQLDELNFQNIYNRFISLGQKVQEKEKFQEEPIIVLIVYETPSNPCSERQVLKDWFKKHNYNLTEFNQN